MRSRESPSHVGQIAASGVTVTTTLSDMAGANPAEIPERVTDYVAQVIGPNLEKMKAAGRTDDEILEATLAAVLGAATARLEKGLALLAEDEKDGI